MITDAMVLNEVREGWEFVRESRNLIVGNCNVATLVVGSDGNQKSLLQLASGFRVFRIGRGATSTSNRGQVREQEGAIRLFNVFQSRYASLE